MVFLWFVRFSFYNWSMVFWFVFRSLLISMKKKLLIWFSYESYASSCFKTFYCNKLILSQSLNFYSINYTFLVKRIFERLITFLFGSFRYWFSLKIVFRILRNLIWTFGWSFTCFIWFFYWHHLSRKLLLNI